MRTLIMLALLALASCSGFFNDGSGIMNGVGVNSLALADGSGFLSTDGFNEITPFIFKDTNTGKKYLFFASDRGGDYDIYYAEMNSDGKFARPVKMDVIVNTTGDEISPAVFFGQYSESSYGYFLVMIRSDAGSTNIVTISLNSDLSADAEVGVLDAIGEKRVSLKNRSSLSPTLLLAYGENYWQERDWNAASIGDWMEYVPKSVSNSADAIFSADGFTTQVSGENWVDWFIFSAIYNGSHQIFFGAVSTDDSHAFYRVIPYVSSFNDKDPVVDETDSRVYFSSDRYGKNNYDLYRYNLVRYDMISEMPLARPSLTMTATYPEPNQVTWEAVPGAARYKVFRNEDPSIDDPYGNYVEVAEVTGTVYTDNDLTPDYYYYYKVQAVNGRGVSGVSYFEGGYYGLGVF